jgi:hypothetical protein
MRRLALVLVLSSCTHPALRGTQSALSGSAPELAESQVCSLEDPCSGGSGLADGAVTIAVSTAILGTLALAAIRHVTRR